MKLSKILAFMIAIIMCVAMFAGCANTPNTHEVGGQIIYGSTTELSGDLGNAWWTNNATDKAIRDMIDDYDVVVSDQAGDFVENKTVVNKIESVVNDDGTKTFTVTINEGLKFNNGDPITAANYVAYYLVGLSPAAKEAGAKTTSAAQQVVGGIDYQNGDAKEIAGLRLIDEYTYSISITADFIPYYFDITYASLKPVSFKLYAPSSPDITVKDDGDGVYVDGGELTKDEIDASRYVYEDRISAGPYTLKKVDKGTLTATLEINENYAGNFEGQKPSIKTILVNKVVTETEFDSLKTGAIDFLAELTGGDEVKQALALEEEGKFTTIHYDRNGYGKIMFQCDFGPTQFKAVRHAIAYLLDRNEFANQFCEGYGSVVHGPYGIAMWMYQDAKEDLNDRLNTYSYNVDEAIKLLEEDGWVLAEDGSEYKEGIRYKKVTDEEAGDYEHVVTLDNGDKLMALEIEWSSSENNPVSELLAIMLANGEQTAQAGMKINQNVMSFDDLLNYMYRDATVDEKYGVKTYGMYNLASNFTAAYDQSYAFTMDPELVAQGYNSNFTDDEKLDQLSMDMVYGVESGDKDQYLKIWVDFIDEWNDYLPEIPLYSNVYYDIMSSKIKGLECNALWSFEQAVVYAWVEE
ncbi:MAG: ABC transporter substrate-binding protein [Clostridia bacterium]|nr:ABC transporter substrate-binding protein [Clostridia bacterium]